MCTLDNGLTVPNISSCYYSVFSFVGLQQLQNILLRTIVTGITKQRRKIKIIRDTFQHISHNDT
jgi:hypothetical protein